MPGSNRTTHVPLFCPNSRRGLTKALGAFFVCLVSCLGPGVLAGQPFEVEGRMVAVEGGVPRGAVVELVPARSELELDRAELSDLGEGSQAPSRSRTGVQPDGSFHLAAPEPGLWVVRVEAPGRIPLRHTPVFLQDLRILDTAVLMPTEDLEVLVTDLAGRPRPGIRVEVRPAKEWREHRSRSFEPARRSAVTGEDGRVRLSRAVGEEVVVRVCGPEGPESSEVRLSGRERAPADPVRIVLTEGAVRELTVREAGGRPAAGFGVRVGEWGWPVAVTDDDGRARVRVGSETTRVEISSPAGWTARVPLVPGAAGGPVEIQLPPPVEITGTVLEQNTREPLAGAWVWLGFSTVTTDRAGDFVLEAAPATEVRVFAAALEHQPWWFDRPVEDGRVENLRILLPEAVVIRGRVVDGAGEPVAGGDVRVRPAGLWRASWKPGRTVIRVEAGPEGRFRIPARAAEMFELRAEAEGFAPTELRRERSELVDPLDIVLRPGAAITGRAVDPDGEPLEGVEVSVFEALESPFGRAGREDREPARRSTTGTEGTFFAEHLPAGTFDVELKAPGRAPRLLPGVDPSGEGRENGEPLDLGDLVLSPGVALEGRVVGPDREPVGEAEVLVGDFVPGIGGDEEPPPGLDRREATTDDDGRFVVEDLPPGRRVTVWAKGPGNLPGTVRGIEPPAEEPLEIRLRRGVRLFGRVVDPEGSPVARAFVRAWAHPESDGGRRHVWSENRETAEDGLFDFDAVPRAEMSLRVTAHRLAPADLRGLSTESGEEVGPVEIRLEAGARVEGRVLDPTGAPVAGAHVNVAHRAEEGYRPLRIGDRSGPGGVFELVGVPPGKVRLSAFHAEQRAEEEIDLGPGGAVVDLVLEPERGLRGRVVDPQGRPVEHAQVEAQPVGSRGAGPDHHGARTGPLGRFRFDVDPGDYRLTAFHPDFAETVVEPVRCEGGLKRVEIRLDRGMELTGRLIGLAPEELSGARVRAFPRAGGRLHRGHVTFEGGYRIPGLTAGVWQVEATVEARSAQGTARLQEGEERATLDLEFPEGLTLTGVLLRNGEPVVDVTVYLTPAVIAVGANHSATTGHGGRFRFRGLEPGEYRLWGRDQATGHRVERRVEVWGDRDIRIETWATRVTGTLVDAGGAPVNQARVELQSLTGGPVTFLTSTSLHAGNDGRFVLPAVEEGAWRLIFHAEGRGARVEEIQVSGAEMDLGTLVLEAGAQVVLEPRSVTGEVPGKVILVLLDPNTSQPVSQQQRPVEPDGRARFQGLPTGSWRAVVATEDSVPVPLSLEVVEGGSPPPVPVVLEPRTELRVDVPELMGAGVPARAAVRGAGGASFDLFGLAPSLEAGKWPVIDGQLMIPALPAGSWTVEVTAEDGRVWTGTAITRPGDPAVLVLE